MSYGCFVGTAHEAFSESGCHRVRGRPGPGGARQAGGHWFEPSTAHPLSFSHQRTPCLCSEVCLRIGLASESVRRVVSGGSRPRLSRSQCGPKMSMRLERLTTTPSASMLSACSFDVERRLAVSVPFLATRREVVPCLLQVHARARTVQLTGLKTGRRCYHVLPPAHARGCKHARGPAVLTVQSSCKYCSICQRPPTDV
jgi:hypothetical protein